MLKIKLLIFSFLLVNIPIYAQIVTPFFEMEFYFEDGVGNRDTVVLGADTLGSSNIFLPEVFNEQLITEPFDSVFEVRVAKLSFNGEFSKRGISYMISNEPDCLTYADFAPIIINAVHFPITISYNYEAINETWCYPLHATIRYDYANQYYPPPLLHCVTHQNSIVIDSTLLTENQGLSAWGEIENEGFKSIQGIDFFSYWDRDWEGWPSCDTTVVGLNDFDLNQSDWQLLLQNNQTIEIETEKSVGQIGIYSLNGQKITTQYGGKTIAINQLTKGIYVLTWLDSKGNRYSRKFFKA